MPTSMSSKIDRQIFIEEEEKKRELLKKMPQLRSEMIFECYRG
jgi:hypothetical protein